MFFATNTTYIQQIPNWYIKMKAFVKCLQYNWISGYLLSYFENVKCENQTWNTYTINREYLWIHVGPSSKAISAIVG